MSAELVVVAEAEEQLRQLHVWWLNNVGTAPTAFLDEFENLTTLLRETPRIGHPFRRSTRPGVRRLYMRRSKHWLYYVYDQAHEVVYILAIWSAARGSDPPL